MAFEVPLALWTTFSPIGAGAFMVLAALLEAVRLREGDRKSIDMLSVIPCLAVVLGLVAACFGFQDQTSAVGLLGNLDGAVRLAAIGAGVLLSVAAVLYCLRANLGRAAEGQCRILLRIVGALGLLYVCIVGFAHKATAEPSWATLATPAQMLGFSLLGGSALATMVFEHAGALDGLRAKRILTCFAALGAALGIGGFAAQLAAVSGMAAAAVSGADLVRAASMHVAVGLFCLAATLLFEVMAIRMKEAGFHSVIAVASAFAGVFSARLVFYALQVAGAA